jgi:hypothetical protein
MREGKGEGELRIEDGDEEGGGAGDGGVWRECFG